MSWAISFSQNIGTSSYLATPAPTQVPTQDTAQVINSLISNMNMKEKIGQMIIVYHAPKSFLKKNAIGGSIIMQNMLKKHLTLSQEIKAIQEDFPIGIFTSIDQEGGDVNRLKKLSGYKKVPSPFKFSQLDSTSQQRLIDSVSKGMYYIGLNLNLAPVIDPSHDSQGNITLMGQKERAFGRTHEEIVVNAKSFCEGFKRNGISSTTKHFPGYDVKSNSDHDIAVSLADSADIYRRAQVFQNLAKCSPFIMMSSIQYPKFDGLPSVFSNKMVNLAKKLAPEALIMTDDLWGAALRHYINPKASLKARQYPDKDFKRLAQMAFLSGNDLFMITYPQKALVIQSGLEYLITRFPNLEYQLDQSIHKILWQKARMGLIRALRI